MNTDSKDDPRQGRSIDYYSDDADMQEMSVFMGPRDKPEDDELTLDVNDANDRRMLYRFFRDR